MSEYNCMGMCAYIHMYSKEHAGSLTCKDSALLPIVSICTPEILWLFYMILGHISHGFKTLCQVYTFHKCDMYYYLCHLTDDELYIAWQ